MTDTIDFANIFPPIQLSKGKHETPAEGVCFYEAVAFFAGEPHSDRPECVCPVLTDYGILLNDNMPDDIRNKLLVPMIGQVAGTRDTGTRDADNQIKRADFLAMWAVNKTLPIALRAVGLHQHAAECESAIGVHFAALSAQSALSAVHPFSDQYSAAHFAVIAAKGGPATNAAISAAYAARTNPDAWAVAVEGLRQAVLIGRHDGFATDPASKVDDFINVVNNKKVPA